MRKTRSGVGLMQVFFILNIISNGIILLGVRDFFGEAELSRASIRSFGSAMCFSFLISLIAFGALVYAVYKINQEASDFSSSHEDSVSLAIICYVIGFFGELIYTPIGTFLYAFGTVFLVKELAPDFEKKVLWSAAGVEFLTGIGFIMMFSIGLEREVSLTVLSYQVYWIVISTTIGYLLFIIAYRRVGEKLGKRTFSKPDQQDYQYAEPIERTKPVKNADRCPKCDEDSLKVKEGRYAICSECGYVEEVEEKKDEK